MMQRCTSIFKRVDIWREGFSALQPNSITVNCFGCLQCVVTPDTLAQVAMIWHKLASLQESSDWTPWCESFGGKLEAISHDPLCKSLGVAHGDRMPRNAKSFRKSLRILRYASECVRQRQILSDLLRIFVSSPSKSKKKRGLPWMELLCSAICVPASALWLQHEPSNDSPYAHPHHPWRSQANWAAFKTLRGLRLGLDWVVPAKAKTQLARAGRKLREDQVDRHRREIFAKVADWPILVAKHCKLSHVRPNTAQAQRKQFCQMFTTRKPGVWPRKHCENTCESTMRV